jgi:hypothetical protein
VRKLFLGLSLIAAGFACGDSHGPADAGVCVNEPSCNCNDGRRGRKVCDVDTHAFVMCECDPGSAPAALDAGARPSGAAADGGARPGSGAAGRMSTPAGRPQAAAGSGGATMADAGASTRGNGQSGRNNRHGGRR